LLEKLKQVSEQDQKKFDLNMSGTSATIMIQTPKKIYLAWVGDCHAVLCKKERKVVAVKLTGDKLLHTPSDEREMARIFQNRGDVKTGITLSGDKKPRIYVRGRTYPGLSTSRSLGDLLAHHIGATSEPSVRIINLSKGKNERFVAIGTDGIWDNIAPEDLVEHINEHGLKEIGQGSEYVCNKARDLCVGD
jgi:serine/threonine protein phosphatase PrpC